MENWTLTKLYSWAKCGNIDVYVYIHYLTVKGRDIKKTCRIKVCYQKESRKKNQHQSEDFLWLFLDAETVVVNNWGWAGRGGGNQHRSFLSFKVQSPPPTISISTFINSSLVSTSNLDVSKWKWNEWPRLCTNSSLSNNGSMRDLWPCLRMPLFSRQILTRPTFIVNCWSTIQLSSWVYLGSW